jgi:hypothetical protein
MAINISALPVSLGPISEDLGAPATAAATALLVYSLFVAMPGAKIGKLVSERRVLQVSVVAHGMAMGLMATSTDTSTMNIAQAIAGLAAAALGAALVSVVAVGLLGIFLASAFTRSELPADLHVQALSAVSIS